MMLDDSVEQWRSCERLSGYYEVSNLGRVRRAVAGKGTRVGRILTPRMNRQTGYFSILPSIGGRHLSTHVNVHTLVAEAFLPPKPSPTHEVNHRDAVKTNNRADNLEWVTPSENTLHALQLGLVRPPFGWNKRLTERQVRAIRGISREFSSREIGEVLGINTNTVKSARRRLTWRDVT